MVASGVFRLGGISLLTVAAALAIACGPANGAELCGAEVVGPLVVAPPTKMITVGAPRFVVALPVCGGCGYSWRFQPVPPPSEKQPPVDDAVVRYESNPKSYSEACSDAPAQAPTVGGATANYFLFRAHGAGTTTITFEKIAPGQSAPDLTDPDSVKAYSVSVRKQAPYCCMPGNNSTQ